MRENKSHLPLGDAVSCLVFFALVKIVITCKTVIPTALLCSSFSAVSAAYAAAAAAQSEVSFRFPGIKIFAFFMGNCNFPSHIFCQRPGFLGLPRHELRKRTGEFSGTSDRRKVASRLRTWSR